MEGTTQIVAGPSSLSPLIGILYAEDFDEVSDELAGNADPVPADVVPPPLTQADVDRACDDAVAAARLEWQNQREQTRNDSLVEIAAALRDTREAGEQIASAAAESTAVTILALLSGVLPHFCNEHGIAEARAIVDHIIPMLRSEPRVVVRVHPDLASDLRREFVDLQVDFSGTLTVLPTAAEPGDVKIEWENGSLSRDTRQILQAMQDALGQLGLQQARETTPKRRMAHAE